MFLLQKCIFFFFWHLWEDHLLGVEFALGLTSMRLSLISPPDVLTLTQKSGKYLCLLPSTGDRYGMVISSLDHFSMDGVVSRYFMNRNSHEERYIIPDGSPLYLLMFFGLNLPLYHINIYVPL